MSKPKTRSPRKKSFTRRFYRHPKSFFDDFGYLLRRRKLIRRAMRELISYDFRERLMMAVTEVNGCRYCRYYHAKEALKSGISAKALAELLNGKIPAETPPEEYTALAYAQHWAEENAQPDPDAVERLKSTYGKEKAEAIHLVLRMIRIGNLSGNLLDFLLFKLSFGRYGLDEREEKDFILAD